MIELIDNLFLFSTSPLLEQTHCTFVACDPKWGTVAFYSAFWTSTKVVYLHCCLAVTWLVLRETSAVLVSSGTPYNHAPCHVTSCKATYVMNNKQQPTYELFFRFALLWLVAFMWCYTLLSSRLSAFHMFLVHAGLFEFFHNPLKCDINYRISVVCMWPGCMYIHMGNLGL